MLLASLYVALLYVAVPTAFFVIAVICTGIGALVLVASLFGPTLRYRIASRQRLQNDSEQFLCVLEALTDAQATYDCGFEVLTNGDHFYEAELATIGQAEKNVNIEAYIFDKGEIGRRFVEALTERARAGVRVNLLCDAFGSLGTGNSFFAELTAAGGKVAWYNSPRWHRVMRFDNRTHRELMVIDGRTGFIGGAGVADHWYKTKPGHPRWRDTMVKVEGKAVTHLQATFAENWLETTGELLVEAEYFGAGEGAGAGDGSAAMVVNSSPTNGGSTRARILMQMLVASAARSIHVASPYFLPDKSLTEELCRAMRDRGVEVTILVPGKKSDHMLTRSASRRGYGPLLKAGATVCEYQPAMIHAKILIVDGLWSVMGSTNLDNRSFGINDEVNIAIRSPRVAERLERDFQADLAESRGLSYSQWQRRPVLERVPELLGWVIQQQQ